MKKYFIQTYGCQMNQSDSQRIAGDYQARGFRPAKTWQQADEIVINTCSVRQTAEDRVRGFISNITLHFRLKKNRPKLILTGCMLHHGQPQLRHLLPEVDEILPINEVGFNSPYVRKDKHHAFVPISSGCNSFCSYCIVPFARGPEQSRSLKDILTEVAQLVSQGYREITLLGQNVNSYGLEKINIVSRKQVLTQAKIQLPTHPPSLTPQGKSPFVDLLEKVCQFPEVKKIRFLTSNPWDFHDCLITCIAKHPQIDRFIHLPVQSGSNRILKLMNRGYTQGSYLRLIAKIRRQIPQAIFGTDIIVGFPTETETDFQATLTLARQVDFKVAFVAKYSPRPHTYAASHYPDDVTPQEKKRRWQILDNLINKPNLAHRPQIIK